MREKKKKGKFNPPWGPSDLTSVLKCVQKYSINCVNVHDDNWWKYIILKNKEWWSKKALITLAKIQRNCRKDTQTDYLSISSLYQPKRVAKVLSPKVHWQRFVKKPVKETKLKNSRILLEMIEYRLFSPENSRNKSFH